MSKSKKYLIDTYATLALLRAETEKQLRELRPDIVALGEGLHVGREHTLNVIDTVSESLSVSLAKSILTPAQIAQCTVVNEGVRITVEN